MQIESSKKYLIKNSFSTLIRVGVSSISTLIITPFIIKSIGLSLFGYISITSFFISYAGIFDIGISKALVYLINGEEVSEKQRNTYISSFYAINLFIIFVILSIGFISIFLKLPILGKAISPENHQYFFIAIICILVLVISIYNMLQFAILESFFKLDKANYGVMMKILVLNILYVLNLITYNNIEIYILSALISVLTTSIFYHIAIIRTVKIKLIKVSISYIKEIFKVSFKFAGVGIFSSINSAMPTITITYFSGGLAGIAILDVITKLSMSIINLGGSIARPFFALTRINPDKIRKQWKKIFVVYFVSGLSFISLVILFRNQITDFFFHDPDKVHLLNYLLIIYVVAAVIYLIGQPLSMYLMGVGKINLVTKVIGVNSLLFLIAFVICERLIENVLICLSVANFLMAITYTICLIFFFHKVR